MLSSVTVVTANMQSDETEICQIQVTEKASQALSFIISLDKDLFCPRNAPPKRLTNYKKKQVTKEDIEARQQLADAKRKENENEMIKRIVQRREECRKLNENFEILLAYDAKQKGLKGAENMPPLSRGELIQKFRAVNKDYNKIASTINRDSSTP